MLTIHDSCRRLGRRDFLRIGSLGLGGLTLADLLAGRAAASEQGRPVNDKSVVFLFLHGGPSQTETFDPKMGAPAEVRHHGRVVHVDPRHYLRRYFPRLAALAHRTTIVRSYRTGDGNHDIEPIMCPQTLGANVGAVLPRVAGANHDDRDARRKHGAVRGRSTVLRNRRSARQVATRPGR